MVLLIGQISYDGNERPLINIGERTASPREAVLRNNDNIAAKMRVADIARIVSFNREKQTAVVQPLIREKILDRRSGNMVWAQLPPIPDVPVCFPQFGNFVLTMPVEEGDEVLLVFTDRCMDSWWAQGGVQNWNDRRRHSLSDAIAVVGISSKPNAIEDIADDAAELRTKNGETKVRIEDDALVLSVGDTSVEIQSGEILAETSGASIELSGSSVSITGVLRINGIPYMAHTHTGVDPGPGVSGPVSA